MSDYVAKKIGAFEKFLDREIVTLDDETVGYAIVYDFLATAVQRIRWYINYNAPSLPPEGHNLPADFCQRFSQEREQYLSQIAALLRARANRYHPLDGSVPEDIRKWLLMLAQFSDDLRQGLTKGCECQWGAIVV